MKRGLLLAGAVGLLLALIPQGRLLGAGILLTLDPGHPERIAPPWPGPLPPRPPRPLPHPLPRPSVLLPIEARAEHVEVDWDGPVARTSVRLTYYNPNPRRVEGQLLVPLPRDAHWEGFAMEVHGRMVEAERLPADQAREIYEDFLRKARDPGLLEMAGQDLYRVRIFPFEPQEEKEVLLKWTVAIPGEADLATYRYPFPGPANRKPAVADFSFQARLRKLPGLQTVYCPTHELSTLPWGRNGLEATFGSRNYHPPGDLVLHAVLAKDGFSGRLLTHRTPDEPGYFLWIAAPPRPKTKARRPPQDVVFVLDTSGSMAGAKLKQAREALAYCIDRLDQGDRFNVIRFSTSAEALFPRLLPAEERHRARAHRFLQQVTATGGTAIEQALRVALESGARQNPRDTWLVFLTDGKPTVGERDPEKLGALLPVDGDGGRIRTFPFGLGHDVNTRLLDGLAERGRGFARYVLPEEDLERPVSSFFDRIQRPALVDARLSFHGPARPEQWLPQPLPDLYHGDRLLITGRYQGQGRTRIQLRGQSQGEALETEWTRTFPGTRVENDFLPRLWATRQVGALLEELRREGDSRELREEIARLARRHGIVTPETAWLILEDEDGRQVTERNRLLPEWRDQAGARTVARRAFEAGRQAETGETAVAGARLRQSLKAAGTTDSYRLSLEEGERLGRSLARSSAVPSVALPGAGTRREPAHVPALTNPGMAPPRPAPVHIAGRAFYPVDGEWRDAWLSEHPDLPIREVVVGSEAYFQLLKEAPETASILALGRQIRFLLGAEVLHVRP